MIFTKGTPGSILLTTLLLGACATDSPVKPQTTQPSQQTAATPTPVAVEPERIFPPPAMLDGLEAAKVLNLLGQPPFKRQDNPALIWQYRTSHCALDLFLYRDGRGGTYKVRHFETRNRGKAAMSAKDCFTALITAHEKASSS